MPTISAEQAKKYGYPSKTLQTILIPRSIKLAEQRKYLKDNGYVRANYRTTINFNRWLQTFPIKGAIYNTVKLPNGIELVYQRY